MGKHGDNPILNTLMYDVEFPDGTICPYTENVIADNIYAQVDSEGIRTNIIDAIIDHFTDGNGVSKNDQYFITKRGHQHLRKTTSGWKLIIAMKYWSFFKTTCPSVLWSIIASIMLVQMPSKSTAASTASFSGILQCDTSSSSYGVYSTLSSLKAL